MLTTNGESSNASHGRTSRRGPTPDSAAVVVQTENGQTVTTAKRAAAALIAEGEWNGYPTIDGDKDDARFMDPPGSWVVLFAKGTKAPRDASGFVQRVAA